jgi:integrase
LFPNARRGRRGSPVSPEEIDAIFGVAARDHGVYGARDAAMIALVCGTGLRSLDVVALQVEQFDPGVGLISWISYGQTIAVNIGAVACRALDRWLGFRGRLPGPLINPIRRPDRILNKPITNTAINSALCRRSKEADILPFTASDVARTNSMLVSGRWHAPSRRPYRRVGSFRLATENAQTAPHNPGQSLVVRFLSRYGHTRRRLLLERLNRLALLISEGKQQAFEFDWTGVYAAQFPLADAFGSCNLRSLNKMKSALHGVLREGAAFGVLDENIYSSIVRQKWTNKP